MGKGQAKGADLRTLLRYAAPYRISLGLAAALMLIEAGVALSVPWLTGQFAGQVLSQQATTGSSILLVLLCVLVAQAMLRFSKDFISGRVAERLHADLTVRIYDHLQSLPLAFYQQRRQGDVLALLTYEISRLTSFVTGTLLTTLPRLLMGAGALIMMYRIDAKLAVLILVLLPAFWLVLKIIGRRLRPLAGEIQEEHARALAIAQENIAVLPVIKTFAAEERESQRHRMQVERVARLNILQKLVQSALEPAVQLVAAAGVVLLLWLASGRIATGALATGEVISFLLYAALLAAPIGSLASVYGQTQTVRGSLQRMQQVLEERPEPIAEGGLSLGRVAGEIELRNVGFAYAGRSPTLREASLIVRAGETVAITGHNGAGKSTLVHLLMRLMEPTEGSILIDGIDIASVGLASLRQQIAIVPQHVLLFNASAWDNIAYAKPAASRVEVEAAARLAQAHGFIAALPAGYETLIGDNGVRLSGGQRQRIALARALLKDPPILILDEATAMFDPDGERAFLRACRNRLRLRTVIIITHRPASLALADRIVRLENGAFVDERDPAPVARLSVVNG